MRTLVAEEQRSNRSESAGHQLKWFLIGSRGQETQLQNIEYIENLSLQHHLELFHMTTKYCSITISISIVYIDYVLYNMTQTCHIID